MKENILLMLGNGFDLTAGLKSRYQDFFNHSIISNNYNKTTIYFAENFITKNFFKTANVDDILKMNNINIHFDNNIIDFWSLLFSYYQHKELENWYDVENILKITIENLNLKGVRTYFKNSRLSTDEEASSNTIESKILALFIYLHGITRKNDSDIYEIMLEELKKFEAKFKKYMILITSENKDYYHCTEQILEQLLFFMPSIHDRGNKSQIESVFVFNFNYTFPFKYNYNNLNIQHSNVHGDLYSDTIFGVDHSTSNFEGGKNMFTKLYRKLFSTGKINKQTNEFVLSNKIPIDVIKIFGLSLTSPDHTYFQTIFDVYDIYNSNIVLEFYYTIYDKRKRIKEDYVLSVFELIKVYSNKSKHEYDTNNNTLITKLIMENRLKIIELKIDENNDKIQNRRNLL